MYILGYKMGHDPAACLMRDGEIVAAVEEERLNRIKHSPGISPWKAIRYCLDHEKITLDQVDHIVYAGSSAPLLFFTLLGYYLIHWPLGSWPEFRGALGHIEKALHRLSRYFQNKEPYQEIFNVIGGTPRRVICLDHHFSHAASAYYFSGFREATIITADGKGDATSVLFAEVRDGEIRVLKRYGIPHSIGFMYAGATAFLGFEINEGEYKMMGLAAYGIPRYNVSDIFSVDDHGAPHVDPRYTFYDWNQKYLSEKFDVVPRRPEDPIQEVHKDIAASFQKNLEDNMVRMAKCLVEKTGKKNLCLAGGVALNVKMNQALRESGYFDDVFIQPAAGDAGTVLGAVAYIYWRETGKMVNPLRHLYWGQQASGKEIEKVIQESRVKYEVMDDIPGRVATILAEGKVIGWMQGAMEFGPRSLGRRTILADPRRAEMKDVVNSKIKFREEFRPFAPSMLASDATKILERYTDAPYMILSFNVKKEYAHLIPAVVHADGTVRPQIVSRETHPLYHSLLKEFKKLTGVGVLLNTSLNRRGEPICARPEEALDLFLHTDLDYLVLGDYLISK